MRNPILILATIISAGALILGFWSWQQWAQTTASVRNPTVKTATVLPAPRPLPAVQLVNQNGEEIQIALKSEHWSLWFLGFTHCPDVCPNTLALLKSVKQMLSAGTPAKHIELVFVSVDPERDTPEVLKSYVSYFDPDMIGLTGNREAIDTLTSSLYLPYALDTPDEKGQYNVEHSGALVLIGPDAAAHAYFTPPHIARDLAQDLRLIMQAQ